MSELIGKFIGSFIFVVLEFYSMGIILDHQKSIRDFSVLSLLALDLFLTTIIYTCDQTILTMCLVIILMIVIFKIIFKEDLCKVVAAVMIFLILDSIFDLIVTSLFMNFITFEDYRSIWYFPIASNFLIAILIRFSLSITSISTKLQLLTKYFGKKTIFLIAIFCTLTLAVLTITMYYMGNLFRSNENTVLMVIIFLIFLVLLYLFIKEICNYEDLQKEYNSLFKYVKDFEDWMEEDQYNKHEYKNQLAILRTKTNDKKVIKEIDKIINITSHLDSLFLEQLANVPKGGIKGLLYYKTIIAHNNKVNLLLDISKNAEEGVLSLSEKQVEELTKVIGIFFDNAIEAASQTKNKNVTVEVYMIEDKLNFIFSNSYSNEINLDRLYEKGFSTKGKKRGKGLYFAKKVLNTNQWMQSERQILDHFYIQKIIINV